MGNTRNFKIVGKDQIRPGDSIDVSGESRVIKPIYFDNPKAAEALEFQNLLQIIDNLQGQRCVLALQLNFVKNNFVKLFEGSSNIIEELTEDIAEHCFTQSEKEIRTEAIIRELRERIIQTKDDQVIIQAAREQEKEQSLQLIEQLRERNKLLESLLQTSNLSNEAMEEMIVEKQIENNQPAVA